MQGKSTTGERVYRDLRRGILELTYLPGADLEENSLVAQFGVSRTPVREALIRLASEGLVQIRAGRGARVMPLEVTALRDFFEALDLTSRALNRLAAARRSADQLARIEEQMTAFEEAAAQRDDVRMSEINHRFHEAVGEAADSSHLLLSYRRLLTQSLRLVRVCYMPRPDPKDNVVAHVERTIADHRRIAQAIRQQDIDAAESSGADHADLFRERVKAVLLSPPVGVRNVMVEQQPISDAPHTEGLA